MQSSSGLMHCVGMQAALREAEQRSTELDSRLSEAEQLCATTTEQLQRVVQELEAAKQKV